MDAAPTPAHGNDPAGRECAERTVSGARNPGGLAAVDSFTTWTSLLATWMLARSVLENWIYWMCADLIMVCLFVLQGYPYTAGLFFAYTVVSVLGLRSWWLRYKQQAS